MLNNSIFNNVLVSKGIRVTKQSNDHKCVSLQLSTPAMDYSYVVRVFFRQKLRHLS